MSQAPQIHKYHFGDIRESILTCIQFLFDNKKIVRQVPNKTNHYIATQITDSNNNLCDICLISTDNGVLIHTSFLNQKIYDRLWMIDPFLGRVSYIEITNPNMQSLTAINPFDKTDKSIEMFAWPEDLNFLNTLLITAVESAKTGLLKPNKPKNTAKKLLNI